MLKTKPNCPVVLWSSEKRANSVSLPLEHNLRELKKNLKGEELRRIALPPPSLKGQVDPRALSSLTVSIHDLPACCLLRVVHSGIRCNALIPLSDLYCDKWLPFSLTFCHSASHHPGHCPHCPVKSVPTPLPRPLFCSCSPPSAWPHVLPSSFQLSESHPSLNALSKYLSFYIHRSFNPF